MDKFQITSVISTPAGILVTVESDVLNDVREFLMSESCWMNLPYNEGEAIDEADLSVIEGEAEFCKTYASALRILSYAPQSKIMLIRKLCQKGFPKDAAERAADLAAEEGVLDEVREASHIADYSLRHKYWGKKRLAAELMQKGYGRAAISAALDEIDSDAYAANLAKLLSKKPMPDDKSGRDKYIASLCRLGYSLPEILRQVKEQSEYEQ